MHPSRNYLPAAQALQGQIKRLRRVKSARKRAIFSVIICLKPTVQLGHRWQIWMCGSAMHRTKQGWRDTVLPLEGTGKGRRAVVAGCICGLL